MVTRSSFARSAALAIAVAASAGCRSSQPEARHAERSVEAALVAATTDFGFGGNLESNAELVASPSQVRRAATAPPPASAVVTRGGNNNALRLDYPGVAYANGRVYVTGGLDSVKLTYQPEVRFAAVTPGQPIPTYAIAPSTIAPRAEHATVIYNGYLYVIGGADAAGPRGDIQYARLEADGAPGAFSTSANTFAGPRRRLAAFAWNNFLYVVGGWDGTSPVALAQAVQYAPIRADGSLGTFVSATGVPSGWRRHGHALATAFGKVYLAGGIDVNGTPLSDVQVANLHPDGRLSGFTGTSGLPEAREGHQLLAYRGYLYLVQGQPLNTANEVAAAPILANGLLGPFTAITLTNMVSRYGHGAFLAGDFLYTVLGRSGTTDDHCRFRLNGRLGDIATSPAQASAGLPTARHSMAVVTYGGYAYAVGGCTSTMPTTDACASPTGDLLYGPVNANGTVSSWTVVPNAIPPRGKAAAVAFGGHLYVIGGADAGNVALGETLVAPLMQASGAPGPFHPTGGAIAPRWGHTAHAWNDRVLVIGGRDAGSFFKDVLVAKVGAGGELDPYSPSDIPLPFPRAEHASVLYADSLFVLGGVDAGGTALGDLQAARLDRAAGTLGEFTGTASWMSPRTRHAAAAFDGRLYVYGGFVPPPVSAAVSKIEAAPIFPDGTVGAPVAQSPTLGAADPAFDARLFAHDGALTAVGGRSTNGALLTAARSWPTHATGTLVEPWLSSGVALPSARTGHCTVTANGFLYVIGGSDGAGLVSGDAYFTPVNDKGSLGPAWTPILGVFTPRSGHACAVVNHTLYVTGGTLASGSATDDVQYARLNADGSLGPVTSAEGALLGARTLHGAAAWGSVLYVAGGSDGAGALFEDLLYAPVQPDGSLGSFTRMAGSLLPARSELALTANNGWLYAVGGTSTAGPLSQVAAAPLSADGTPGPFEPAAELPEGLARPFAVAFAGHLFVAGGQGKGGVYSTLLASPLLSTGKPGSFTVLGRLPTARAALGGAIVRGWLSLTGGINGIGGTLAGTDRVLLTGAPPDAIYTRVFDLGAPAETLNTLTVSASSAATGALGLTTATATTSAFSPPIARGRVAPNSTVALGETNARYLWTRFFLDDAASMVTEPNAGGQRDLTGLALDYTLPAPTLLAFTSPQVDQVAGACAPLKVQAQVSPGVPAPVRAATVVTFSNSNGLQTFYSDPGCTSEASASTLTAGQSELTLYYRDTVAGTPTLTAEASGLVPAKQDERIRAAAATRLGFTGQPQSGVAGTGIAGLEVAAFDSFGNVAPTASGRVHVGVASPAGVTTFLSVSCDLSAGRCSPVVEIRKAAAGIVLNASCETGCSHASGSSQPFDLVAAAANQLQVVAVPANFTLVAGAPLPDFVATYMDPYGNVATAQTTPVTVTLSGGPGGVPLLGTTTVAPTGGVAVLSGLKIERANAYAGLPAYTLQFQGGAFTTSQPNLYVSPAAPARVALQSPLTALNADVSTGLNVVARDAYGNQSPVSSTRVTLALGANPGGATLTVSPASADIFGNTPATLSAHIDVAASGYTLIVSDVSGTLASTETAPFEVTPGAVNGLAFVKVPATAVAGDPMTPAVEVALVDRYKNLVPTAAPQTVTLALSATPAPGATLSGTKSRTTVSGVARFPDLAIDKAGSGYTLAASVAGWNAVSAPLTIVGAAPHHVVFRTHPPASVTAGSPFGAVVELRDRFENLAPADGVAIALSASGPSTTLGGTTTVATLAGLATFTDLLLTKAGAGYVLAAAGSGLSGANSSSVTVSGAAPASMSFTSQPPATATAGVSFTAGVTLLDAYGNPASSNVLFSYATSPGGAMPLSLSAFASGSGVATATIAPGKAGTYSLRAHCNSGSCGSVSDAISDPYEVVAGAARSFQFLDTPPTPVVAGATLPSIRVQAVDAGGNPVAGYTGTVTLALAPANGLLGTLSAAATGGIATFSDLSVQKAAGNYRLTVSSATGLTLVGIPQSSPFAVVAAPASRLVFATQPASGTAGTTLPSFSVLITDAYGNTTAATDPVTVQLAPSTPVSGQATVSATAGVATFDGVIVEAAGTGRTLRATAAGYTPVDSAPFDVAPGAAYGLAFLQQPSTTLVNTAISPPVKVQVVDRFGNQVPGQSAPIILTLDQNPGSATPSGVWSANAVNSVATFDSLRLDKPADGYVLQAASSGLASALSGAFRITSAPPTRLAFTTAPQAVAADACSAPVTLAATDASNNPAGHGEVVALTTYRTPPATGSPLAFFSDASCQNAIASVSLGSNATASFHFRSTVSGRWTVTATTPFATTTQDETISAGGAAKLVFKTPSRTVTAGRCSAVVTLEAQDAVGNAAPVVGAVVVDLLGEAEFYADATCSGARLSSVTIPDQGTTAPFYFRANAAGSLPLTARAQTLADGLQTQTVLADGAAKLAFESAPAALDAGACTEATVKLTDPYGNAVPAASAWTVRLTSTSTAATFFGEAGCATSATTASIASGASAATFYYRDTHAGTPTVTVSVTGGALAAATWSPTIAALAPTRLRVAQAPAQVQAGIVFSIRVDIEDDYGNRAETATDTVTLTLLNDNGATLGGTLTVAAQAGSATFGGLTLGRLGAGYAVRASSGTLADATSSTFTVVAGPPASVAFTLSPDAPVTAGAGFDATVRLVDSSGNPTEGTVQLALTNPNGASLAGLTQADTQSAEAHFTNLQITRAGSHRLTATVAGTSLSALSPAFDVVAAAPAQLAFVAQPANVAAGEHVQPPITVALVDRWANVVTTATGYTVQLSVASGPQGGDFLTEAVSAAEPALGLATFDRVALGKTGTYTLKAAAYPALTTATSTSFEVSFGNPSQLRFVGAPTALGVDVCSPPVTVQVQDKGGNPRAPGSDVSLTLDAAEDVRFYSDASCTLETRALSMPAGSQGVAFTFRGTASGNRTLSATGGTLQPATVAVAVGIGSLPAIQPRSTTVRPGATLTFTATGGTPPYAFSLVDNPSGATLEGTTYTAGPVAGVADRVQVTDSRGASDVAEVRVDVTVTPAEEPAPPLNGWGCGCSSSGPLPPMLLLLGALAFALRRRRKAGLMLLLLALASPGEVEAARSKDGAESTTASAESAAKKRKKRAKATRRVVEEDVASASNDSGESSAAAAPSRPSPPVSSPSTPPATPPAVAPPAAAAPVAPEGPPPPRPAKKRDARPSLAVINVDMTIRDESLDSAAMTDYFVSAIDSPGFFRVISTKEIAAMIGFDRQKQLMGCGDSECLSNLSGALGVDLACNASVGRIGDRYIVAGRLMDPRKGSTVGRASVNTRSANGIMTALQQVASALIDSYKAGLSSAEAQRLVTNAQPKPMPSMVVTEEAPPAPSSGFGLHLGSVFSFEPRADPGRRGAAGGELGASVNFRSGLEAGVSAIIAPNPGGRVLVGYRVLDAPLRITMGVRAAYWPGPKSYGGGPALLIELPLSLRLGLTAHVAGEYYRNAGTSLATLGGVGIAAHL